MIAQRYFPNADADRNAWLKHYAATLPKYGALVGIDADEIAETQAGVAYYLWVSEIWYPAVQQDKAEATAFKKLVATGEDPDPVPVPGLRALAPPPPAARPGVLNRLFKQVQRIKLHPDYAEGIGADLGILPVADTTEHPVPEFTATPEPGPNGMRVRIDYTKYGHAGVVIESRINGGPWSPLGRFNQKTAYDESALAVPATPENRDYRLRWLDKDEAHGDWSAIQTVLVGV